MLKMSYSMLKIRLLTTTLMVDFRIIIERGVNMKVIKNKKLFALVLSIVLLNGLLISTVNASSNLKENSKTAVENIPVYLEVIDEFTLDSFKQTFKEEDYEILESMGKKIIFEEDKVIVMSRSQALPKEKGDINLFINDEPIAVNIDGTITLPITDRNKNQTVISLDEEGNVVSVPTSIRTNQKELIFRLSSEYILESMQEKEELAKKETLLRGKKWQGKGYGDKYEVGDWVHCNRFNGPLTDCVHYDKKTHLALALRNFYGSDCEAVVLGYGPCTQLLHKYCNQIGPAGGCSHYTKYESGRRCKTTFHIHHEKAVYDK